MVVRNISGVPNKQGKRLSATRVAKQPRDRLTANHSIRKIFAIQQDAYITVASRQQGVILTVNAFQTRSNRKQCVSIIIQGKGHREANSLVFVESVLDLQNAHSFVCYNSFSPFEQARNIWIDYGSADNIEQP